MSQLDTYAGQALEPESARHRGLGRPRSKPTTTQSGHERRGNDHVDPRGTPISRLTSGQPSASAAIGCSSAAISSGNATWRPTTSSSSCYAPAAFTAAERAMSDSGEPDRVVEMRDDFQRVTAQDYKSTNEQLTDRKVLPLLNNARVEPELTKKSHRASCPGCGRASRWSSR